MLHYRRTQRVPWKAVVFAHGGLEELQQQLQEIANECGPCALTGRPLQAPRRPRAAPETTNPRAPAPPPRVGCCPACGFRGGRCAG